MNDKVSPERSIYIPETTIIPSIDISHFAENEKTEGPYTFEIHKRGTQVLQRDRTFYFRTNSREELLQWCRVLCDVSSAAQGTKMISAPIPVKTLDSASSSSSEEQHQQRNDGSMVSIPTLRSIRSNLTATPPTSQPKNPNRPTLKTEAIHPTSSATTTDSKTDVTDEKTQVIKDHDKTADSSSSSVSSNNTSTPVVVPTSIQSEKEKYDQAASKANGQHSGTEKETTISNGFSNNATVDDDDIGDGDDDAASIMTARAIPHESKETEMEKRKDEEESKVKQQENEEKENVSSKKEEKRPAPISLERPASRASVVTDSESSVYFSSTSGPPSPTSSNASVGDHHFDFPALQDNDNNNKRNSKDEHEDEPSTPKPGFYQPKLNFSI